MFQAKLPQMNPGLIESHFSVLMLGFVENPLNIVTYTICFLLETIVARHIVYQKILLQKVPNHPQMILVQKIAEYFIFTFKMSR